MEYNFIMSTSDAGVLDAFHSRIRKMSPSEKAMHRAMAKVADKISNSSPMRKKYSPILPTVWNRQDMCSVLRCWSATLQKERPGIVFTPSDAKQALAAQDISEDSVAASQWSEWETAIDEIVKNQDTSHLYTSESELSTEDQYHRDDSVSLPSLSSDPVRESNVVLAIDAPHLSLGTDSVEVAPSMLIMEESGTLSLNQWRLPFNINEGDTELSIVNVAPPPQTTPALSRAPADELIDAQNSEKEEQLCSLVDNKSSVPTVVSHSHLIDNSLLQMDQTLNFPTASDISACNSNNSSFASNGKKKKKKNKKKKKAKASQTNNIVENKGSPVPNSGKAVSTANVSHIEMKKRATSATTGSSASHDTAEGQVAGYAESQRCKETSSGTGLVSSGGNNGRENSPKPLLTKGCKLSAEQKDALRILADKPSHVSDERSSCQQLTTATKANIFGNAILLLAIILVPLVTMVGVYVVLSSDESHSIASSSNPFVQQSMVDISDKAGSWIDASSTPFITYEGKFLDLEEREGVEETALNSVLSLGDVSNSTQTTREGGSSIQFHSTGKPRLGDASNSTQSTREGGASIQLHSTAKPSTTAVSSAKWHWRKSFQNLFNRIKQKINYFFQHLFQLSRRKAKTN